MRRKTQGNAGVGRGKTFMCSFSGTKPDQRLNLANIIIQDSKVNVQEDRRVNGEVAEVLV